MPWPKGKPRSPETCLKMSIGMKGKKAWNKGKHSSEETRRRQAEAQRGRTLPEDVRKKISDSKIGKSRSEEIRRKISESRRGTTPWNKGIPLNEDSKRKLSESQKTRMTTEVRQHLSEINIGKRLSEETKRKMSLSQSGPNNHRWRGGLSYLPYCPKFNEAFKERVRDRFNRTCFLCGSTEETSKHCVHHIDYNKNSICNGHEWGFVPLCRSCHTKTNGMRWYWFNLLINYWALNPEITL